MRRITSVLPAAMLLLSACVGEPTALDVLADSTPGPDSLAMAASGDTDSALAADGSGEGGETPLAPAVSDAANAEAAPDSAPTPEAVDGLTLVFPSDAPEPTATATPLVPEGFTLVFPTATPVPPTPTPAPTATPAPTVAPTTPPTAVPTQRAAPTPTKKPAPTSPPAPTSTPAPPTPTAVPPTATPIPTPTSPGSGVAALEAQMVALVNDVRAAAGKPALAIDASMADVARAWSATLPSSFNHNPSVGSQIPGGWYAWGENIAYNGSMEAAQTALENSSGHYANMVNGNFTHIGIGIHLQGGLVFVTQVFAGY